MEIKEVKEEIGKLVHDLREAHKADVEKYGEKIEEAGKELAQAKEREEKMMADYDALKEKVSDLEAKSQRPPLGGEVDQKKAADERYNQIFRKYCAGGPDALSAEEKQFAMERKASILADDQNAGFLAAPPAMEAAILGNIRERSPIRMLATVRSGRSQYIQQRRRTTDVSASWIGESGTRSETTGLVHGMEKIFAHEMYMQLEASRQMLGDADINMESYFGELAGDAFGVLEGTAFVSGNGVDRPEGITTNSSITTTTSATAAVIAAADLIDIKYDLKAEYRMRASWLVNRANVARVMKLTGGDGQYLWIPSLQAGQPDSLLGHPVYEATDLASTEATSSNVALFADFSKYVIYDRAGMEVLQDPYNGASSGEVRFHMWRRVGGLVVLPEAFVLYQLS